MGELETSKVIEYWKSHEDKTIYRVLMLMQSVETWVKDSPAIDASLDRLAAKLSDVSIDLSEMTDDLKIIKVLNCLSISKAIRLMQMFDNASPGKISKMLSTAEEYTQNQNDDFAILLNRNMSFERLRLLSRVFDEDRFKLIISAIGGDDYV